MSEYVKFSINPQRAAWIEAIARALGWEYENPREVAGAAIEYALGVVAGQVTDESRLWQEYAAEQSPAVLAEVERHLIAIRRKMR